jgi:hypothetical protein
MKYLYRWTIALFAPFILSTQALYSADAKATTLTCVGLYSEASDGYISSRVSGKDWPSRLGRIPW